MAEREEDSELDSMLARSFGPAQGLEPTSGFVASVMQRVQQEAEPAVSRAPAPIAFPWQRALPGICLGLLAIAGAAVLLVSSLSQAMSALLVMAPSHAMRSTELFAHGLGARAMQLPLGWLGVALVLSLLPVAIARQLAEESSGMPSR